MLISLFGISALLLLSRGLTQDGWLALVSGRVVAQHGIPYTDTLTSWTYGHHWIDQQWLGQLMLYAFARLGGVKLALLLNMAVATATAAAAAAAGRACGGSARRVALVAAMTLPSIAVGTWHLRTQTLAAPLFLIVYLVLRNDRVRPSPRVLIVLPLLALWGNVHGSVILGALLVAVDGLAFIFEGRRREGPARGTAVRHGLGLVLIAAVGPLLSPYGPSIVSYYEHTLLNSAFSQFVAEWQKTTLSFGTVPFFILAGVTIWIMGRSPTRLDLFARLALLITMTAALLAMRNVVWFSLVALVVVPGALDEVAPPRGDHALSARVSAVVSLAAVGALAAALVVAVVRPMSKYERNYPERLAASVGTVARAHPTLRIYSSEMYADWLLWKQPELAGRVAYDARFELLSRRQLTRAELFNLQVGANWRDAARGAGLLVLRRVAAPALGLRPTADVLAEDPGTRRLYANEHAVVLLRPA